MNPEINPYAPGAGNQPPELAGRDRLRAEVQLALSRIRRGNHAKSQMMIGLRGVGKTVLLNKIRTEAEAAGILTIDIEAPEDRSLPAILLPKLRICLLGLSKKERSKDLANRALSAIAGFVSSLKVTYQDISVGVDLPSIAGLADNGDLEHDLFALLESVALAAKAEETALAIFIDELQYVKEAELSALIMALHKLSQKSLPIVLIGAGLPQLRGKMGNAKSYAERLFEFPAIGPLDENDAEIAIVKPAESLNVNFTKEAVKEIFKITAGYPYFLQEWGKHSWEVAEVSPIDISDVQNASDISIAALDQSFFRVRFDRLTPAEKRYVRAMAELGEGPHRSGDIAAVLEKDVNKLSLTRSDLIKKGMIYSPNHGDTAFTVPLFHEFLKRILPGDSWKTF